MMTASFDLADSGYSFGIELICVAPSVRGNKRKKIQASTTITSPAINKLIPKLGSITKTRPLAYAVEVPVESCLRASAASSVISRMSAKSCNSGETRPAENVIKPAFSTPPSALGA